MKSIPSVSSYKQKDAVFRIKGLNTPWMEVAHLGQREEIPRYYEFASGGLDFFYLLVSGNLRLSGLSSTGKERVLLYMESGTIFKEIAHLSESPGHSYSLRSLDKSIAIRFPTALLHDDEFYSQYPHLIANMLRSLSIKASAFFEQISTVALLESHTQVCRLLFQIWKESGEKTSFDPGISQSDLSNILGLHRSSLTRALKSLREQGVIGLFSKKRLEILDSQKLMRMADVVSLDDQDQ